MIEWEINNNKLIDILNLLVQGWSLKGGMEFGIVCCVLSDSENIRVKAASERVVEIEMTRAIFVIW